MSGALRHEHAARYVEGPIQQEWTDHALCLGVGPDVFFPKKGQPTEPARAICARCPVRVECLEYAVVNAEQYGIWAGTDRAERRAIRRARGLVA